MCLGYTLDASTRSSFKADKNLEKTDSAMSVNGTPYSSAAFAVHFPVPF